MPSLCTIGGSSVSGTCNIYTGAQVQGLQSTYAAEVALSHFGCGMSPTRWDNAWCPTTRVTSQSGNSGAGPDYLGVFI